MAHGSFGKRLAGRRWQRIRKRILTAEPLCRRCAEQGVVRLADQIDHIRRLEDGGGDEDANLRPLCVECHRIVSGGKMGCDASGMPRDPSHWWNK